MGVVMNSNALSTASSVIVTSNVDIGDGRHLAVAGQEVIFICTTMESTFIEWKSDSMDVLSHGHLRYTANDNIGRIKDSTSFRANLTSKSVAADNRTANLTTTLTFEVACQYTCTELVIVCGGENSATNATLFLSGKSIQYNHAPAYKIFLIEGGGFQVYTTDAYGYDMYTYLEEFGSMPPCLLM